MRFSCYTIDQRFSLMNRSHTWTLSRHLCICHSNKLLDLLNQWMIYRNFDPRIKCHPLVPWDEHLKRLAHQKCVISYQWMSWSFPGCKCDNWCFSNQKCSFQTAGTYAQILWDKHFTSVWTLFSLRFYAIFFAFQSWHFFLDLINT